MYKPLPRLASQGCYDELATVYTRLDELDGILYKIASSSISRADVWLCRCCAELPITLTSGISLH